MSKLTPGKSKPKKGGLKARLKDKKISRKKNTVRFSLLEDIHIIQRLKLNDAKRLSSVNVQILLKSMPQHSEHSIRDRWRYKLAQLSEF